MARNERKNKLAEPSEEYILVGSSLQSTEERQDESKRKKRPGKLWVSEEGV
jgi:hypothetical protein